MLKPKPSNVEEINLEVINTASQLHDFADRLKGAEAMAVDLEADSMYHFQERVCLIQIAARGPAGDRNAIIDPLEIDDLSSLKPLFADPEMLKILHGADYDVRSLYRDFRVKINGLFDTELACRFLGMERTGLETVILDKLNIKLDKKYQKKDWSMRPLPAEMLTYAARDVMFLAPLRDILQRELAAVSRLEWVIEESTLLSRVRPAEPDGQPLFMKFKGAGKLNPRTLAVLESLLIFRRAVARKKDKPLFKIMGNHVLMKIALARPRRTEDLTKLAVLSRRQEAMYARGLVKAVLLGLAVPEERLPVYPRQRMSRLDPNTAQGLKALKLWRQRMADRLNLAPGLVCSNDLLHALARNQPRKRAHLISIDGMKRWQRHQFGGDIINTLVRAGKTR